MTKKQSVFNEDLVTELAKNCKTQDDLFGPEGIFKQLMKAVLEKSLEDFKQSGFVQNDDSLGSTSLYSSSKRWFYSTKW